MTGQTSGNDRQIFGKLGSVSLNDIIQLLGMSKRTATLELRSGDERGRLYFRDGQIIHATAGSYEGEESYIELLGWGDAEFAIEDGIETLSKISITKSTEALLLSTMTTLDEIDRLKRDVPIRIAPSITQRRRPPRPRPRARRRFRGRAAYGIAAAVLLAGCIVTAILVGSELGIGDLEDSYWSHLPAIHSPPSQGVSHPWPDRWPDRWPDPWTVAKAVWDRPASAPTSPTPTPTATTTSTTTSVRPAAAVAGDITIVVEPWARIVIDGAAVGETPLGKLELAPGEHHITLVNDHIVGHIQDNIVIEPGQSIVKRYRFGDVGFLRLVATPWANVSVDGRSVGQTPLGSIAVPAGSHSVSFVHPELGETEREIHVVSGQTTLVRVQLQ